MQSRRNFLASVLLLPLASRFCSRSAHAWQSVAHTEPKWLKDIAAQLRDEFNLPAVWVAVSINDKVEAAVVGVRKMGDLTPATIEDELTVASISKPMVGLWIATLVDQGKLTYSARVLDVLPELAAFCLPEHQDITLVQLLTHTAGLVRDPSHIPTTLKLEQYPSERLREAREVLSLSSPPGSKGKEVYSNSGLTLAATMAERVAGEPYEVSAGRFYREILGLKSWGVWSMNLGNDLDLPWPHSMVNKIPVPQPPQSLHHFFVCSSGSAHCSITDLVKFGLIATNSTKTEPVLRPETWTALMASIPGTTTTPGSFFVDTERFNFSHSGSLILNTSNLSVYPEWKVSIACHTNAAGGEFPVRANQLLSDAVRKRIAKRNPPPPCSIALTGVDTVDSLWQNVIVPKSTDDKIRIRIRFQIKGESQTGDLQTLVKLGDSEHRYDRFRGLAPGNYTWHFPFDVPPTKTTNAIIKIDALETAGNETPGQSIFSAPLMLQ